MYSLTETMYNILCLNTAQVGCTSHPCTSVKVVLPLMVIEILIQLGSKRDGSCKTHCPVSLSIITLVGGNVTLFFQHCSIRTDSKTFQKFLRTECNTYVRINVVSRLKCQNYTSSNARKHTESLK